MLTVDSTRFGPDRPFRSDPSKTDLTRAIEGNLLGLIAHEARVTGSEITAGPRLARVSSNAEGSLWTTVMSAQLHKDEVDDAIAEVVASLRGHDGTVTWIVGPSSSPRGLGNRLIAHGFSHTKTETGMALDMQKARERPISTIGLEILPVRKKSTFDDFVAVHASAHGMASQQAREGFGSILKEDFAEGSPRRLYVGYLDGIPVADCMRFYSAGVIGIYAVATRPDHRRRGLGTAMTRAILDEAFHLGYRVGILTSSPMGRSLYHRMGFREYCRIEFYEHGPPTRSGSDSSTGSVSRP